MLGHLLCKCVDLSFIRSTHLNRFGGLSVVLELKRQKQQISRASWLAGLVEPLNSGTSKVNIGLHMLLNTCAYAPPHMGVLNANTQAHVPHTCMLLC